MGLRPLQIIGTDFAGPIMYRAKRKKEKKIIEKRLITRRGCLEKICSDNAKTFVAASKWIKRINK